MYFEYIPDVSLKFVGNCINTLSDTYCSIPLELYSAYYLLSSGTYFAFCHPSGLRILNGAIMDLKPVMTLNVFFRKLVIFWLFCSFEVVDVIIFPLKEKRT